MGLRTLRRLTGLDQLELEQAIVGWRPVPEDHLPVIGPGAVEGTYFAVMHSGVTLAALVGERVAQNLRVRNRLILRPTGSRARRRSIEYHPYRRNIPAASGTSGITLQRACSTLVLSTKKRRPG